MKVELNKSAKDANHIIKILTKAIGITNKISEFSNTITLEISTKQ